MPKFTFWCCPKSSYETINDAPSNNDNDEATESEKDITCLEVTAGLVIGLAVYAIAPVATYFITGSGSYTGVAVGVEAVLTCLGLEIFTDCSRKQSEEPAPTPSMTA